MTKKSLMGDYPLFIQPATIKNVKARDQTKKEAKEYFNWLMNVREERVDALLEYFGEHLTGDPKADLLRIGMKVTEALRRAPFCEYRDGKLTLTGQGGAVGVDMGLLIAQLIQQQYPHVGWEIEKRKRITYNSPVLTGFGLTGPDPARSGLAEAFSIIRGEQGADCWWLLFDTWMGHVAKNVPPEDV